MQSRVVGQMESWRGRGRRAGRDALRPPRAAPGGLNPSGGAGLGRAGPASADPGRGGDRVTGAGSSGRGRDDASMTADVGTGRAGTFGAGRSGPGQDRAAAAEQRPVGRPEQARVTMPDRRENAAEYNRVPEW